jgi:hypothetical protein
MLLVYEALSWKGPSLSDLTLTTKNEDLEGLFNLALSALSALPPLLALLKP